MRSSPLRRVLAAGLLGAAAMLHAPGADAAACCGTGHGLGQRLAPMERAAIGASTRFAGRIGSWAADGSFVGTPSGSRDLEARLDLGWIVKPHPRVQVGATLPILLTSRALGEASSTGGGIGDVGVFGRFDVVGVPGSGWLPAIALTLGAQLPTGRPTTSSTDALGADVTGLGAAEIRPGILLEKNWSSSWSAMLGVSVGMRTAFADGRGGSVHLAPRTQIVAATGPTWPGKSVSVGVLYEHEESPSVDGVATPGAARNRTAALAVAGYDVGRSWTLLASAQLDLPIDGLGSNELAAAAGQVGLRYTWSIGD